MGPGRPAVVLDKETQEPLVIGAQDSYGNFFRAVDGRPGHYSLVILDEHHSVINKELVGHITLNPPRNAASDGPPVGGDPVVLRALALMEKAMDRAFDLAACTVEHHAGGVAANAEVIRANADATRSTHGLAPRNAATVATPESTEDDEEEREPTAIESVAVQCLTALDVWWQTRAADKQAPSKTSPTTQPAPAPQPAPPSESAPQPSPTPTPAAPPPTPPTPTTPPPAAPTPPVEKVVLTPAQAAQMQAVMSMLSAREQLAARSMVMRMKDAERAQWLEEFSAMTVDQAVERVREFLPDKVKAGAK